MTSVIPKQYSNISFDDVGVTTIHPPTTPPYPPPQQLFPVQQLATNLNQVRTNVTMWGHSWNKRWL